LAAAAAVAVTGCANYQWARLAPPGILKYEDIASQKPPNPAVEKEIAQIDDASPSRFPRLSETPAAKANPSPARRSDMDGDAAELMRAKNAVDETLGGYHEEIAKAREDREALEARRESLLDQLDRDQAAAAGERAKAMPTLEDQPPSEN
jgi:hypothetical protein